MLVLGGCIALWWMGERTRTRQTLPNVLPKYALFFLLLPFMPALFQFLALLRWWPVFSRIWGFFTPSLPFSLTHFLSSRSFRLWHSVHSLTASSESSSEKTILSLHSLCSQKNFFASLIAVIMAYFVLQIFLYNVLYPLGNSKFLGVSDVES